ncbi:undecaprenyl diphosphate synthase family protein [Candidatus Woesearchaeota archaeon]|nr:undecaprenyl diphosphate synthase family protein [Candidatus Woesearchaeota archaeon]
MLDVLNFLKKKEKPAEIKHLVISIKGIIEWAKKNEKPLEEVFLRRNKLILDLVNLIIEKDIPIFTIYILSESTYLKSKEPDNLIQTTKAQTQSQNQPMTQAQIQAQKPEYQIKAFEAGEETDNKEKEEYGENEENEEYEENEYTQLTESLTEFFNKLANEEIIHNKKVKISVLGKWYGLPGMVVESIKSVIDKTKDYDSFFLNFCVNYDGQEEIIDAFKLIIRSVEGENINEYLVNKNLIKENVYSSYFIPPDIIIETGIDHKYSGVLLWDSVNAKIFFIEKLFPDIDKDDVEKILQNK